MLSSEMAGTLPASTLQKPVVHPLPLETLSQTSGHPTASPILPFANRARRDLNTSRHPNTLHGVRVEKRDPKGKVKTVHGGRGLGREPYVEECGSAGGPRVSERGRSRIGVSVWSEKGSSPKESG
jgi:hypothetical protein